MSKKLLLIDGSNLIFRAYYASENLNIETLDGRPANAIKLLISMINKIIIEESPTNIFIALDTKSPTFRHENYEEYKAGRQKTPDKLNKQFPMARDLYNSMGIINYGIDGYEADDLIATYAKSGVSDGYTVKIISGDKDLLQLVDENITVMTPKIGFTKEVNYTPDIFKEKYDINPNQFIEYKALVGDKSDNIIGVDKVGDKTARKLLLEYGDITNIITSAKEGKIKGKVGENLISSEELIYKNIDLVTLICDTPLLTSIKELEFETLHTQKFISYLEEIGFSTLANSFLKQANLNEEILEKKEVKIGYEVVKEFSKSEHTSDETFIYTQNLNENYFESENLGIALSSEQGNFYFENISKPLIEWLESEDKKIIYNEKAFRSIFPEVQISNIIFDSYLAINLLDNSAQKKPIDFHLTRYGARMVLTFEEVYKVKSNPVKPEMEIIVKDLCLKANALKESYINIVNEIERQKLNEVLYEIEMPLSRVLSHMETVGIYIDNVKLEKMKKDYEIRAEEIANKIKEITDINYNSPKQLSEYLFTVKQISPKGIKKTKSGYSTDIVNLEKVQDKLEVEDIDYKLIDLILKLRKNQKILNTYLLGIEGYIKSDQKIHPLYNPLISETGRISTQDPSIQNIPIRSEEGKSIRELFAAPEGKVILAIDYSQVELRIMAHYSDDANLISAFKSDKDIHSETAKNMFGDEGQRSKAKAINFGIIYGMSKYGLAKQVSISNDEAQEFIDIYFEKYPAIKNYIDDYISFAQENGYVHTLFNRKRVVENINTGNFNEKEHAKRVAINTPIQGTAADLIKIAMIKVYEYTHQNNINIIMQIHDELVFEMDEVSAEVHTIALKEIMESIVKLKVPLKVDGGVALNWLEAK